jgi:hypothetical protein
MDPEAVWSLWRRDKSLVPTGNRAKPVVTPTELNEKSYGVYLNCRGLQIRGPISIECQHCKLVSVLIMAHCAKSLKRASGHVREPTYINTSPDNRYLTSVGSILVWVAFYVPSAILCYTETMKNPAGNVIVLFDIQAHTDNKVSIQ